MTTPDDTAAAREVILDIPPGARTADRIMAALSAAGFHLMRWRPTSEAPKDGTVFDAWLGDCDESDRQFYCTEGTRRSSGWRWHQGKFRPMGGLPAITTFVQPTHFAHLPPPPEEPST